MFCGNDKMEKGLLLSTLSLLEYEDEPLNIYILTMSLEHGDKKYYPIRAELVDCLDRLVKEKNPLSSVRLYDMSEQFVREMPEINMDTRFTPYCMLRLYADYVPNIPQRMLYLDTDILFNSSISELYSTELDGYDVAGVLDFYGSHFFRRNFFHRDYLNSGVLLLNMEKIRRDGVFARCRERCKNKKMFMPDQSAINKVSNDRKRLPRRYNEQRRMKKNTVCRHFTTSFRLFPYFRSVSVKPWNVEQMHNVLKLHKYDGLLEKYTRVCEENSLFTVA